MVMSSNLIWISGAMRVRCVREAHAPQRASAGDPLKICMLLSKELCTVSYNFSSFQGQSCLEFGPIDLKLGVRKYF